MSSTIFFHIAGCTCECLGCHCQNLYTGVSGLLGHHRPVSVILDGVEWFQIQLTDI